MTDTLHEGMLWLSSDPDKPLEARICQALDFYRNKYGEPDAAVVSSEDYETVEIDGVEVSESPFVQPGHVWVGQREREVA